jgi:hypothetical protein
MDAVAANGNGYFGRVEIYGLMAEFDEAEQLLDAAKKAYAAGYRKMDGYSPIPVHGLFEAMGRKHTWMPQIVLTGGVLGCIGGYSLCFYMSVIAYAHNVGGRPVHSWPAYIPITFECTVLLAALSAVFGMIAINGLPMPYHPVFNVPRFLRASNDGFFLCIEASDPHFDPEETRAFLQRLSANEVVEVEK